MLKAEEILSLGMEKLELKDDDKIIHKLLIYKDILKNGDEEKYLLNKNNTKK